GRTQETHEYLYWELGSGNRMRRGLRMDDWKAVQMDPKDPVELYDLNNDIGETTDLAALRPDIMAKVNRLLATCRVEARPQVEPETENGWKFR
ncbi:MAG: hypothetical protein ACKVGW_18455, partial [Verrucomicrobiia bacterium]